MKSTNYFSHDSNARNDEKLVRLRMKHGAAGYGVYFMIIERLREEANYMCSTDYDMLAFDFRVDAALVQAVVEDFELFAFTEDNKCFYSESFKRRMGMKDEVKERRVASAKKAAEKRWNSAESNSEENTGNAKDMRNAYKNDASRIPNAYETHAPRIANASKNDAKVKESKVKEKNKEKDIDYVYIEKEKEKPPTPPPRKITFGEREESLYEELITDRQWAEATMMNNNIRNLNPYIDDFRKEQMSNGKTRHENLQDLKSHVNNFIRIRTAVESKRGGKPKPIGQSLNQAIDEIIKQQDYGDY